MRIQLVITAMVENGQVAGVTAAGPVGDKFLCYGMLEMAKDVIREFKPPTIEVADAEQQRALLAVN